MFDMIGQTPYSDSLMFVQNSFNPVVHRLLTSMLVAPASSEFSTNSLTALQTLVMTWLLCRRRAVSAGRLASTPAICNTQ